MGEPNTESLLKTKSLDITPIIRDLFGERTLKNFNEEDWLPSKPYKLIKDAIQKYEDSHFDKCLNI